MPRPGIFCRGYMRFESTTKNACSYSKGAAENQQRVTLAYIVCS